MNQAEAKATAERFIDALAPPRYHVAKYGVEWRIKNEHGEPVTSVSYFDEHAANADCERFNQHHYGDQ